jgi:hypothetical protein
MVGVPPRPAHEKARQTAIQVAIEKMDHLHGLAIARKVRGSDGQGSALRYPQPTSSGMCLTQIQIMSRVQASSWQGFSMQSYSFCLCEFACSEPCMPHLVCLPAGDD